MLLNQQQLHTVACPDQGTQELALSWAGSPTAFLNPSAASREACGLYLVAEIYF